MTPTFCFARDDVDAVVATTIASHAETLYVCGIDDAQAENALRSTVRLRSLTLALALTPTPTLTLIRTLIRCPRHVLPLPPWCNPQTPGGVAEGDSITDRTRD